MLPYAEQEPLFRLTNLPTNTLYESRVAVGTSVPLFRCPSDGYSAGEARDDAADLGTWTTYPIPAALTNYKGVSGSNWGWGDPQWKNLGTNNSWDGMNEGDGLFWRIDWKTPKGLAAITDGTSGTFMVGEDLPQHNHWFAWAYANSAAATCAIPPNVKYPADGEDYTWKWEYANTFRSRHSGGLQFAYADGSVHFVRDAIDLRVYRALATIRGGEVVEVP